MRCRATVVVVYVGLIAFSLAAAHIGCGCVFTESCTDSYTCAGGAGGSNGAGGAGAGGRSASGSGAASTGGIGLTADAGGDAAGEASTGGDSGPPSSCIPSMNNGNPVDESCGVFVSATGSDTTGTGSKAAPYASLTFALTKGTTIYACAGTDAFIEGLTVSAPVTFYGGLDCSKWVYNASNPTRLTAAPDTIPITFSTKAALSAIHDFTITARDATTAGGSSIAVLDNGAALTLANVNIYAGNGKAGADGVAPSPAQVPQLAYSDGGLPMNGSPGVAPGSACTSNYNTPGGAGGTNTCNGGTVATNGGTGGLGLAAPISDPGSPGSPSPPDGGKAPTPGGGGAGETTTASCSAGASGTGFAKVPGTPGIGGSGFGTIDASGYHGPLATLGGFGTPGQGGGGGGGSLELSDSCAGPSGGGGGAGGCGGAPGDSGKPGGSSIGILALNATLSFSNVADHDPGRRRRGHGRGWAAGWHRWPAGWS